MRFWFTFSALSLLTACGGDAESSATNEPGSTNQQAPAPGASQEGWLSDYIEDGGAGSCSPSEDDYANMAQVTIGTTTLYAGWEQVSGDNQDPVVARFDDRQLVYCAYHEDDGPDGRALGITWNGGDYAYVVYTVVGGGSDLESQGGWLESYAPGAISGGGPKVSYVGRVNVTDGSLAAGSFIISVLMSNKVNSHSPAGAVTVLEDGTVEFLGSSAHKPIDADGQNYMDCSDYPFDTKYVFSDDLATLICAESTNCTSQIPCD